MKIILKNPVRIGHSAINVEHEVKSINGNTVFRERTKSFNTIQVIRCDGVIERSDLFAAEEIILEGLYGDGKKAK